MDTLEAKIDREDLKKIKIRPISFLVGVGFGAIDAAVHPQGEGLDRLISQDPSLLQFGLLGGLTSAILYLDNIKSGRTKKNTIYNVGVCFGNYAAGYAIGYSVSKIFQ